ncbi:MAG TPA: tRNA pseudouridine(55) synthase TruB [Patescibacteria group bacterium]|nr:tRNA pseudouridine(55) synthase TruB [Patescibacteria group bacterium]
MKKEGFIVINKPKGITSFGVVAKLRKVTGIKKVGHCGTLDPLATGVLICAVGRSATKKISTLINSDKQYIADIELGKTSNTYDMEGDIKKKNIKKIPTRFELKNILKFFTGEIFQTPPIFSAKKIEGRRAYELARKGVDVKMKKNKVNIYKINLISYKFPHIKLKINCGSGTYIRSLTHDIGKKLKTGAVLMDLKRTMVGNFTLENAFNLDELNEKNIFKNIFNLGN